MTFHPADFPDFFEVAQLAGHDPERLRSGEEITTYHEISDLEQAQQQYSFHHCFL
jgi:hypothetical protein